MLLPDETLCYKVRKGLRWGTRNQLVGPSANSFHRFRGARASWIALVINSSDWMLQY